jgi:putative phage-type endonuclease
MPKTREEWLELRKQGIGASDAATVLGLNPYKTNVELWEEKTGRRISEDIGGKSYVQYGNNAESHLRALFALDFPQYEVDYEEFKFFKNQDYPFIFATLDGWLTSDRKGVLEIKTTEIMRGGQIQKWKGRIPDNYYIQCLHQLIATGFDFVILKAQIKFNFGDDLLRLETRHYQIERSEVTEDLEYLKSKEIEFWTKNVMQDIRPNLILPAI